jgi:hypothetical protein
MPPTITQQPSLIQSIRPQTTGRPGSAQIPELASGVSPNIPLNSGQVRRYIEEVKRGRDSTQNGFTTIPATAGRLNPNGVNSATPEIQRTTLQEPVTRVAAADPSQVGSISVAPGVSGLVAVALLCDSNSELGTLARAAIQEQRALSQGGPNAA